MPRKQVVLVVILAILGTGLGVGGTILHDLHPCGASNGSADSTLSPAPPAVWTQQATLDFDANTRLLSTNVTVSNPVDLNGLGPAFLLNGATNTGYWYQAGVTYNWGASASSGGHRVGFDLVSAVFRPNDTAVPAYEYLAPLGIENGSTVELQLQVEGGCVMMTWVPPGQEGITLSYPAWGATSFNSSSPALNGSVFDMSLMTEWRHATAYFGPTALAQYSIPSHEGSWAGMGVDERIPTEPPTLAYANSTRCYLDSSSVQSFEYQNVTETVGPLGFTTG